MYTYNVFFLNAQDEYAIKVMLVLETHYTSGWRVSLISTAIWQETHSLQQRAALQSPQTDPCQWLMMIQVSKVF